MPRLTSTYMLCVALLGLAPLGCSEDEGAPAAPADAGSEVISVCVPADCQAMPRPPTRCSNGQVPDYDCVRNGFTGRCERVNPRCGMGTDAGPSDAPGLETGADGSSEAGSDASPTDATDGGDAGDDGPIETGP